MGGTLEAILKFLKGSMTLHLVFIALIGLLAYSNTLDAPFHFDDKPNIAENPVIKDLKYFIEPSEAEGLKEYSALISRYIGYFSFALNYRVHGLDTRGYHVVNLAIHIVNGLLVYLLVVLTFRTPKLEGSALKDSSSLIALFTALLFVSHPVQTQAVTYIVQRFASMAAMFYLGSLVFYAGSRLLSGKGVRYLLYGLSLVSAVLAMKTKEIAFTLPVAVAFYEFMFFGGRIKKRLLYLTPILLAMLIISVTLAGIDKPAGGLVSDIGDAAAVQDISRSSYLLTEFRVAVTYLRLLVLPVNQNLDYDYPVYSSFSEPPVFLSFLFLLALFGLGVYLFYISRITHHPSRLIAFGIFWFFITLSVESGTVSPYPICEHRAYLPSVGFFLASMTAAFMLLSRLKSRGMRRAAVCALVLVPLVLCTAAYARNKVWKTETSLWEDVVRKSPRNARAHINLGDVYVSSGLTGRAIMHYQTAIVIKPGFARAYYNLGNAFRSKGRIDMAISQYESAVWLRPDYAEAHYDLGTAYRTKGQVKKAIEHFRAVLRHKPDFAEAQFNLAEAHFNLGKAYFKSGKPAAALSRYKKAVAVKPDYAKARYNIGLIYYKIKDFKKAGKEFEEVLRIDPGHQEAKEMLESCKEQ